MGEKNENDKQWLFPFLLPIIPIFHHSMWSIPSLHEDNISRL